MNFNLTGILFFLLLANAPLWAAVSVAPANDDCSKAFLLKDVTNYCSSPRQFTNEGSTASGFDNPGCFPSYLLEPDNDVWFKFTAIANTVNISVIGAISGDPKGTLQNPQFSLYTGSCSRGLLEIACISDGRGFNISETFINDLAIGGTYYLRVDGRNGKTGSFQLCINNYNPVPSPSSDCNTAVVLCDKSSFTVPSISGAGLDRFEMPPGICLREESSSAWYKWTCDKAGTLSFTLKPVNPADDLDFAVFFLPNGVDDCSIKIPFRCMASGENVNASLSNWARCTGATGLKSGAVDLVEQPGCEEWDDNFVAALQMEEGQSFALVVNNYHNTGNGFSIEFGGTGTFKGPVAHFVVNKLKISQDDDLWVRNKSSFDGGIKNWEWNFGVDAKPATAKGIGPHKVKYGSTGTKSISLSIETSNGCQVTKVRQVTVTEPPPPPPPAPEPEKSEPVPAAIEPQVSEAPQAKMETEVEEAEEELEEEPTVEEEQTTETEMEPNRSPDTTYTEVTYLVKYTATIYFPSDSASLEQNDVKTLEKVFAILQENPSYKVIVEGHTNNIPDAQYCNQLATERASVVIGWLNGKGLGDERIIRKIFGKDKVYEKEDTKYKNRKLYQKAVLKLVQRE